MEVVRVVGGHGGGGGGGGKSCEGSIGVGERVDVGGYLAEAGEDVWEKTDSQDGEGEYYQSGEGYWSSEHPRVYFELLFRV